MQAPEGFRALTAGLHQDAWVFASGDIIKLVDDCLGFVPQGQRIELARFLAASLESKTAAELKGVINREKRDVSLDSKRAKAFFELALQRLCSVGY